MTDVVLATRMVSSSTWTDARCSTAVSGIDDDDEHDGRERNRHRGDNDDVGIDDGDDSVGNWNDVWFADGNDEDYDDHHDYIQQCHSQSPVF